MRRQHWNAVLKYAKGNIWLLVFPLVRALISLKFDFYFWIKNSYMDIIVILFVFGLAWARWWYTQFEISKKKILVKSGLLFQREFRLPYSMISSVVCHQSFTLRPFRTVKIMIDTDACYGSEGRKKAAITLIISEKDCSQIYKKIPVSLCCKKYRYRASKKDVFLFSTFFSSTIPGLLYLGTFIVKGSRIVGEKIEMRFLSAITEATDAVKKISEKIYPFAVMVLLLIALGWLFSFTIRLLRYFRFETSRCGKRITIKNGCFLRWKYYVNYSRINYVDLRQNLLMKVAKTMSVHVSCSGYGKRKNELPVLIPLTTESRVTRTMKMLLPEFTPGNILFKVKKSYILAYIWLPLLLVIGVAVVIGVLHNAVYEWRDTVWFVGVMLEIPLIYFLAVKFVAKSSTGIGVSNKALTVSYCKASRFHTVVVPTVRVAYIKIRRTLFQRAGGCCDIIVYTRGERVQGHRVRGILYDEARFLIENYDKM